jgi:hypothetical protein
MTPALVTETATVTTTAVPVPRSVPIIPAVIMASSVKSGNKNGAGAKTQSSPEKPVTNYPSVTDPRTGDPIPFPAGGDFKIVPVENRVPWGGIERYNFIKEWYDRGFPTPSGSWVNMTSITFCRANSVDQTTSTIWFLFQEIHQTQFNTFWQRFPKDEQEVAGNHRTRG